MSGRLGNPLNMMKSAIVCLLSVLSGTKNDTIGHGPIGDVLSCGGVFDAVYYGDAMTFTQPVLNAYSCRNQTWIQGTMIVDTGCDSTLADTVYEPFMHDVINSKSTVSGFDGSTQDASKYGYSHMWFLHQGTQPTPGQGVEKCYYDTVDGLRDNLMSVSKYYEDGCDIQFTHNSWSGIRGRNPETGKYFHIPSVYSYDLRAHLVHFVMAKTREEAERVGKQIQEQNRYDNMINTCMDKHTTLDDAGLRCSVAISRGNISVYDGDAYSYSDFGQWNIENPKYQQETELLCSVCDMSSDEVEQVCVNAYGTTAKSDEAKLHDVDTQKLMDQLIEQRMDDGEGESLFDDSYRSSDSTIEGMKVGLPHADKNLTQLQLHIRKNHVGHCAECDICKYLKRNLRRKFMVKEPYVELRPGYCWGFDLLEWKTKSLNDNKYSLVMRDRGTGYFRVVHISAKSQVPEAIRKIVKDLRSDPRFKWIKETLGYEVVTEVFCDPAGEQRDDARNWVEVLKEFGILCEWGDPTDKRSDGFQENAVKQMEIGTKAMMMENATPASWWELCMDQHAEVRNHVPMSSKITSKDGDGPTPIEQMSNGGVSRRACYRYIAHLVPVGTPCHVTQPPENTKGSDNTKLNRHRPGIAIRMLGTLPLFMSPVNPGARPFRSKSFLCYDAPKGCSAFEFWGCECPWEMPDFGLPQVQDHEDAHYVVRFDDIALYNQPETKFVRKPTVRSDGKMPYVTVIDSSGYIYETNGDGDYKRTSGLIQKLDAAHVIDNAGTQSERERQISMLQYHPDWFIYKPIYQRFGEHGIFSGVIQYTDMDTKTGEIFWNVLYSDGTTGDLWASEMIKYCIDFVDGTSDCPVVAKTPRADTMQIEDRPDVAVMIENSQGRPQTIMHNDTAYKYDINIRKELETDDNVYITMDKDKFSDVCKGTGLNHAQWPAYYRWIHENYMMGSLFRQGKKYPGGIGFADPFGSSAKKVHFDEGVRFPLPIGKSWSDFIEKHHREKSNALNNEHMMSKMTNDAYRTAALRALALHKDVRADESDAVNLANVANNIAGQCIINAFDVAKILPPKNLSEAMERDDYEDWLNCGNEEMCGLMDEEVFSDKAYTLAQLRQMGIDRAPMPMGLIYDKKYTPMGDFEKNKGRLVQRGHKWNMRKSFGAGYVYETYAAAPNLSSTRLMKAIQILLGWDEMAFDIKQAYIKTSIPESERVPVQFEKGLREYDPVTGEELYRILQKNLYGSPLASRRFQMARDEWMMKTFNQNDWTCEQMMNEKSMFKFVSPEGKVVIMVVHSDDCDMVCEDSKAGLYICEQFRQRFGIKMADPAFMLGVNRRKWTDENGVTFLEMTQQKSVDDLYEEFKDQLPKRAVSTPFPDKCFLSTYTPDGEPRKVDPDEIARNYKREYMHIVGTLLWLGRNCYPEISQGVHQLCRMMAMPYDEAYDAALHMISYCHGQRDRGIRFNSEGNCELLTLYDASNKGDPKDSRVIAGHVVMFAGGPISWECKKALHCGASSSHNEYMAAFHAAKEAKWLRDLLIELNLTDLPSDKPVILLGDNDQATRWTIHGMVTTGNKTVRMNYHWVQECVRDGIVDPRRVDTVLNTSDIFTKSLGSVDIDRLRPGLTGYGKLPPIPDAPPV